MKLTNWQYFALMAAALAALVALTILGKVQPDILVGVLLSILGIGAHISGVNTAVPLQVADAAQPVQSTPVDEAGVAPQ
jgi:predicted hotdog family 3-hydroxylacyl-ACP dehydratase